MPCDRLGDPVERVQNVVLANYHRSYVVVPPFAIVVGDHTLLPDTAGQQIEIFVTGDEQVQGLNFYIQVGDGGVPAGGSDVGPTIQDVDILSTS